MTNKELEKRLNELEQRLKQIEGTSSKHQLSDFTPKELKELAKSGNAQNMLDANSTIEIELITGEKIKLAIMGFNHDKENSITFGLVDCLDVLVRYNNKCTNKGAWKESDIRALCQRLIKLLPQEWQELIDEVEKVTYCDEENGKKQITKDKIFIPSKTEVFDEDNGEFMEGKQYEYYKDENHRIKYCNGDIIWWMLRSPFSGSAIGVSYVGSSGSMYSSFAYSSFYVAPCFVI